MTRLLAAIGVVLSVFGLSKAYAQTVELSLGQARPVFDSALPVSFKWQLTNVSGAAVDGDFHVSVDGQDTSANGLVTIQGLAPSAQQSGSFDVGHLAKGSHSITLQFFRTVVVTIPHHPPRKRGFLEATQTLAFTVVLGHGPITDADNDGLDDDFEHRLLEHYRPFFKFSKPGAADRALQGRTDDAEPFPPIEFADYMKFSEAVRVKDKNLTIPFNCSFCQELLGSETFASGDLSGVLTLNVDTDDTCTTVNNARLCLSDMTQNRRKTLYAFHPASMPTFQQSDMDRATQIGNVGLYGHVVSYTQASDLEGHLTAQGNIHQYFAAIDQRALKRLIKVEYWQFFPFNGGPLPHEGDWDTVQLLVDLDSPPSLPCQPDGQTGFGMIVMVFHYHHGAESLYDFANCTGSSSTGQPGITEFAANDGNRVQFFQDADGNLSHPVVYIEYATHEFWPIGGTASGVPNHHGDGTSFLTATPPNLGEVESPMSEYPHATELMRFNGFWGACCGANWAPPGPALHTEWTWPASSSVGWLVSKQAEH